MKKTQRKTQIGFCKHILVLLFLCFSTFTYAQGQAKTVSGVVKDEANEPLIGVGIQLKGTTLGTTTDIDGKFTLRNVQPENVIIVNSVGYITQELKVGSREAFNVVLVEDIKVLGEVVVVGYGTARKEDLTGAISSVTADALAREQPASVQDMLRTNIAGLNMGATASPKGNTIDMQIRGRNSLRSKGGPELNPTSNPEMPLLVLDGVIYFGELTDINPDDIERIDVLKDASSAAVYGAQGSNGVIIITTKKGKEGKPVIKFSAKMGAWFKNNTEEIYKGNNYLGMRQDVMKANYKFNRPEGYFDDPSGLSNDDLITWMALETGIAAGNPHDVWLTRLRFSEVEKRNYMAGRSYDWEELVYQTGFSQDYSVSISGKTKNTSYYTSLNYMDTQGVVRGDDFSTIRARVNLETKLTDFLSFGVNTQFTARDEGGAPVSSSIGLLSPYGNLYNEDGTYARYPNSSALASNPFLDYAYRDLRNDINNLDTRLFVKVDLPLGFSVQTTYAPRFQWAHEEDHRSTRHPGWATGYKESNEDFLWNIKRENTKDFRWQFDNLLKWNKEFGKHAFDFTFLMNWEQRQYWNDTILGQAIEPDDLLGAGGMNWATQYKGKSADQHATGDAIMARMHYVYDKRYMLTATFRRDGYSAFGKENPRGNFPSIAVGWIFSEEKFFPKSKWMDYGKLRLSWGKNGNREIGSVYSALMLLKGMNYDYRNQSGTPIPSSAYFPNRMANYGLKWEAAESYNVGFDFSVIDSKLRGSFDYYYKNTKDLVSSRTLGHITGYASIVSNMGQVNNQGIELSLNSRNIESENFTWETSFSLDHNTNKIKKLFGVQKADGTGEANDIANKWFIGKSIDDIWDYRILGVWQLGEEEEAAKYGMTPGDFKLKENTEKFKKDKDGNDVRDYYYDNSDKEFIGQVIPKVNISLRNSFTFLKDFSFSFNIYGSFGHHKKHDIAKNTALATDISMPVRPYWTPESPSNRYSKLGSKNSVDFSVWRRADFIRFDNVSLGYSLPRDLVRKVSLQSVNINATLRNIGDISSYPGPGQLAIPRVLTFGLNVTL